MKFSSLIGQKFHESPLSEAWEYRPEKVSSPGEDFLALPSTADLLQMLQVCKQEDDLVAPQQMVLHASKPISAKERFFSELNSIAEAPSHYHSGCTICTGDVSTLEPAMLELVQSVAKELGGMSEILLTSYVSPPHSEGILHFDRQHNYFVQREGSKRWLVSEHPAVECPYDNFIYTGASIEQIAQLADKGYQIELPRDCGKLEFTLEPGDILYVPPGHYHVPVTGSSLSLHYTVTIEPDSVWRRANRLLFDCLLRNSSVLNRDTRRLGKDEREKLYSESVELLISEIQALRE